MKRTLLQWQIEELKKQYHNIEYPEFQREPTVWSLRQKQLLVDSILRSFDIGSIYLLRDAGSQYQCVDGRQRLNAIFSFLGVNSSDSDNCFKFLASNEVKADRRLTDANGSKFDDLGFKIYRRAFLDYEVNIVLLSDAVDDDDLNLQFQRLQVAQILNAGEKLNAMVGEMRDMVFDARNGLGRLSYFGRLGMPKRRFGPQQSASQVILNAVSYSETGEFCRARFIDMQEFFKDNFKIEPRRGQVAREIRKSANGLVRMLSENTLRSIKNRALAVSVLLFYFVHGHESTFTEADYQRFDEYLVWVLGQLKKVARNPISEHPGTWERLQLAITQASVEKPAFKTRHEILTDEFEKYIRRPIRG